jgi:hypothetical protein
MSGSTPYAVRSPSQPNHQYPPQPFSPTHPNRPYFAHEPGYSIPPPQHLVQTPPFPPASIVHSPLHTRPTLASPLPAPTALPPPPLPVGAGPQYQSLPASPPFALQRSYSGHLIHAPMMAPYDGNSSHAHPSTSALQSPLREHHNLPNGRPSENSTGESRPQSKDVSQTALHFIKIMY